MHRRRQYVGRLTPTRPDMLATGPTPHELALVREHAARLQRLTEEGTVALVGRTTVATADAWFISIFWAESDEAAQALLDADPCVAAGVMRAELSPFEVLTLNAASAAPSRLLAGAQLEKTRGAGATDR
ncbi:MAG TPA: YciI family protein [Dehalococcoidia bacterium]|nr:YciI family protein [Dehalococcoidia bacterium]